MVKLGMLLHTLLMNHIDEESSANLQANIGLARYGVPNLLIRSPFSSTPSTDIKGSWKKH